MNLKEICKDIAMNAFNVGDTLYSIKNSSTEYLLHNIRDNGITLISKSGLTYFVYKDNINIMYKKSK